MAKVIPAPGTDATVWSIPTVADELWTMTVRTRPKRMPNKGLFRNRTKAINASVPTRGSTPLVIRFKPTNRMPKPMQISPMVLERLDLMNISSTMPMIRAIGASVSVSNSHSSQLPSD